MKIKNVAMSLVWTYVAVTSAYGLAKFASDSYYEIKYQLNRKKK